MTLLLLSLFLQGEAAVPEPTAVAVVSTDGTTQPYDRALARRFSDWEVGMHTEWTAQVIGADKSHVSVILTERSDYYRLLGLGSGTQVVTYVVESGKIRQEVMRFVVEEHGTQAEAFGRFTSWLATALDRREPDLVRSDGSLIFDGKSAPRMRYWLERWQTVRSQPAPPIRPNGQP